MKGVTLLQTHTSTNTKTKKAQSWQCQSVDRWVTAKRQSLLFHRLSFPRAEKTNLVSFAPVQAVLQPCGTLTNHAGGFHRNRLSWCPSSTRTVPQPREKTAEIQEAFFSFLILHLLTDTSLSISLKPSKLPPLCSLSKNITAKWN